MPKTAKLDTSVPLTEAQRLLVEKNIGYVNRIAAQYHRIHKNCNIDDLISDGYIGLIKAAVYHDISHGARFKTFAFTHVVGAMRRGALKKAGKGSAHSGRVYNKINEVVNEYRVSGQKDPDIQHLYDAVAESTRCSKETLLYVYKSMDTDVKIKKTDESKYDDEPVAEVADRKEIIQSAISILNEYDSVIIKILFYQGKSLAELADILGVSYGTAKKELDIVLTKIRLHIASSQKTKDIIMKPLTTVETAESLYRAVVEAKSGNSSIAHRYLSKHPFAKLPEQEQNSYINLAYEIMKICIPYRNPMDKTHI